jgi:L-threonylcarbamoyladenylate synthase
MTIVINMRDGVERRKIKVAARLILEGKLVAFPTETVYGLGADALNAKAVRKIFEAKGRPADNPLIVHIAKLEDLKMVAREVPEEARLLAKKFWPGPLTLVLPKAETVPPITTGGLDTVAVRMPAHPIALALIEESRPLAAPSANISGKPSPTSAEHVIDDFYGKIAGIIDGGETWVGVESTVLDLTGEVPVLLRPGGLPLEELEEVIGPIKIHPAVRGEDTDLAKAPGMKYRHYSPNAQVVVVEGSPEGRMRKIEELVWEYRKKGYRVGVMATRETDADEFYFLGRTPDEVAKNLFKALRELDKRGVDVIIAEGIEEEGIGLAVMNRLKKAAGYRIVRA